MSQLLFSLRLPLLQMKQRIFPFLFRFLTRLITKYLKKQLKHSSNFSLKSHTVNVIDGSINISNVCYVSNRRNGSVNEYMQVHNTFIEKPVVD